MLQYNGEDHNLVERKNRKDLSIRLGQFFDYYLKGGKPAKWITDGLPATEKGKDWGFGVKESHYGEALRSNLTTTKQFMLPAVVT